VSKHKPRQAPPRRLPIDPTARPGLLELDRFSEADIDRWSRLSKDLDELQAVLYSGVEPQRQRYHADLIEALRTVPGQPMDFTGWVRMVTWRYADSPLSAFQHRYRRRQCDSPSVAGVVYRSRSGDCLP
jgi:hypothetical protein